MYLSYDARFTEFVEFAGVVFSNYQIQWICCICRIVEFVALVEFVGVDRVVSVQTIYMSYLRFGLGKRVKWN